MAAPAASACGQSNFAKGGSKGHLIDTIIYDNAWSAREPAHKLFQKIAGNILQNPTEPKYRKLNVEKVIGKFGAEFKGIAELLGAVGFVGEGPNLVLPEHVVLDDLCAALCEWNAREAKSAAARAEAERIRLENTRETERLKAAKDASRAQLKSLGEQARKDVATKPINASKPQAIKFGSTIAKVAPPPPAQKGG